MTKIIEYKVFMNIVSLDSFNEEINMLIKQGWQPLGGVWHDDGIWAQAMVKFSN